MKTRIFRKLPEGSTYRTMTSPVGVLHLVATDQALHAVLWECDLEKQKTAAAVNALPRQAGRHKMLDTAASQLDEYFAGERKIFDLPLDPAGTEFQRTAWRALLDIPFGQTSGYQALAIRLGGREKARAVGTANGMNPVSIIIPCHRLLGKNGALTGFGGGIEAKRWLLDFEAKAATS